MMRKIVLSGKNGVLEFNFDNGELTSFIVNDATKNFGIATTVKDVTSIKGYKVIFDSDTGTFDELAVLKMNMKVHDDV